MSARIPLILILLLAGCGKSVDIKGTPSPPSGYVEFSELGVSFVHPPGLKATRTPDKVRFGDPAAFVELTTRKGKGPGFDAYVHSIVTLSETLGGADVGVSEQEVPGADAASLLDTTSPPKPGGNARELHSKTLIVRRGDDVITLSAGSQEGSEEKVDTDAVIGSFRLTGPASTGTPTA